MKTADKPLPISTNILDALFAYTLRDYVAPASAPHDVWKHIEENIHRSKFTMSQLPETSSMLNGEMQPRL